MENHHQKTSSKDVFSLPGTPSLDHQDSGFEFRCLKPDSPPTDPYKSSPADHLFFNGRLMPHSFPTPQHQQQKLTSISRATSSVRSKDSLMSSRSNSTSSSGSSGSRARTSLSSNGHNDLEKRLLYPKVGSAKAPVASKVVMAQLYGSSQRWQHIVPVSGSKRDDSRRSNNGKSVKDENLISASKKQVEKGRKEGGILRRLLRWFVVACRKCHSMEPSTRIEMLEGDLNV